MNDLTLISVVDDDESVRESLPDLLRALGYEAHAFSSAKEFLNSDDPHRTKLLILDIAMPEMTGPELQMELRSRRHEIPIIFITAHATRTTCSRVISDGAVGCLAKPFSETALVNALNVVFGLP